MLVFVLAGSTAAAVVSGRKSGRAAAAARYRARSGRAGEGAGSRGGPGVRGADASGGPDAGGRGVREPRVADAGAGRAVVGGGMRAGLGLHWILRADASPYRAFAWWLPAPTRDVHPSGPAACCWSAAARAAEAAVAGEDGPGSGPSLTVSALDLVLYEDA